MVLEKLLINGVKLGIFKIFAIKDVDKSCCKTAETKVIDFDYVKETLIQNFSQGKFGLNQPKSCDALKLIPELSRIDFIEFKGFEEFKKWNKVTDDSIEKQVEKFSLGEKIDESLYIFKSVLQITNLNLSNEDKANIKKCQYNYIILVDIHMQQDPVLNIAANLQLLSEISNPLNVDKRIIGYINSEIDKIDDPAINKPMVKSGVEIDDYYESLDLEEIS